MLEEQVAEFVEMLLTTIFQQSGEENGLFFPLMVPVGKTIQQGNNVFRISLVQRLSVADPSRHGFQHVEGSENVSVFFFQHVANSHGSPPLIPGTARTMPQILVIYPTSRRRISAGICQIVVIPQFSSVASCGVSL
jgi:hypothetical protein